MKRISLTTFSFFFVVIALVVMSLACSYVFGINILSLIIPSIPEPQPISLYPRFFVLIDIVLPISYLFGSLCLILISLRDVLAGRCHYGIRPEIALIAVSFLILGFTLQMLADRVQPASSINDTLVFTGFILGLLALGTIGIAFFHKYFLAENKVIRGKKREVTSWK